MFFLIREATAEDIPAIQHVHRCAFAPSTTEAKLVAALYDAGAWDVSLVAFVQEQVVGHILFSPVTLTPPAPHRVGVGLAPLGVLPAWQKRGIGSALVRAGLQAVQRNGATFVVVLGAPQYYTRFGFECALSHGVQNEFGADDAFMVMWFDATTRGTGTVHYHPEFAKM
ncbi:hypothetical protein SE16_13300 [Ardenticatena maritima]|uniref:N-acetyltransferase domain-containing protein n=2 Tax=Ardenticatena maritima TaxID=872965 RepID=A0A0P6YAE7_9CHLR|nr:hypothetical protein SE16_13300 [Ardenticatena maritima]